MCVLWERVELVLRMNEIQWERECVRMCFSGSHWGLEEAREWEKEQVGVGVNQEEVG